MERLAPENVIGCYGNHDVKEYGLLKRTTEMAIQIPHAAPGVRWFPNKESVWLHSIRFEADS